MSKIGRSETTDYDRQLVKALGHPVRAEALTILNTRVASPNEIAKELGLPVGNVSYHVNELEKLGCVELVRTEQRRGATEHYFRGVARSYLDEEFWTQLSHGMRNGITMATLRILVGAARESVETGLFDARTDRHASVVTYNLDDQGWAEAKALFEETLNQIMEIGAKSEGRLVEADPDKRTPALRATFGMLAFESPSSKAKAD
jgi:DNA-binding transcriptional ArsR family regulator